MLIVVTAAALFVLDTIGTAVIAAGFFDTIGCTVASRVHSRCSMLIVVTAAALFVFDTIGTAVIAAGFFDTIGAATRGVRRDL